MGWIIVVEDESAIADKLEKMFTLRSLKVKVCRDYYSAMNEIDKLVAQKYKDEDKTINNIDVLISDLNLTQNDKKPLDSVGFRVLDHIKAVSKDTYVVVYTGNDPGAVAVKCIGKGDQFFQKTNRPGQMDRYKATLEELVGFVAQYLASKRMDEITYIEGIIFNHTLRTVVSDGEVVNLTPPEKDVLEYLIRNRGYFLNHAAIYEVIAPYEKNVPPRKTSYVDRFMQKLERRIGKNKIVSDPEDGYGLR